MDQDSLIVVTGSAGFIGSCMVGYLNQKGFTNIILVDDFSPEEKKSNYQDKKFKLLVERNEFFTWLKLAPDPIDFMVHLGARTDTTEFDYSIHEKLNVAYSKLIWNFCTQNRVPLIYASSAATYGGGELGYKDDHDLVNKLVPLNPYGVSKNEFDKWALAQDTKPPFWAGLKFFNVYGPNEYHKARMASVIFHAYNQIKNTGRVKLFRSHKAGYNDGEQLRDFIYVEDIVKIMYWMMNTVAAKNNEPTAYGQLPSGLYNVGTGKARTFNDLVLGIFKSLGLEPEIEYMDTPEDIRDKYQYFTQADMTKLRSAGYSEPFLSLEEGVNTYVTNYLSGHYYL